METFEWLHGKSLRMGDIMIREEKSVVSGQYADDKVKKERVLT
jgi:hypothetical protein